MSKKPWCFGKEYQFDCLGDCSLDVLCRQTQVRRNRDEG